MYIYKGPSVLYILVKDRKSAYTHIKSFAWREEFKSYHKPHSSQALVKGTLAWINRGHLKAMNTYYLLQCRMLVSLVDQQIQKVVQRILIWMEYSLKYRSYHLISMKFLSNNNPCSGHYLNKHRTTEWKAPHNCLVHSISCMYKYHLVSSMKPMVLLSNCCS
jgi:hypothetical protein